MRLSWDLRLEAAKIMRERWASLLRAGETLVVDGEVCSEEVEVRLVIEAPSRDERVEIAVKQENPRDEDDALTWVLDAADAFVGEWLESGRDQRFPIDFVEHEYQGRQVQIRVRRRRPSLEAEADRLLEADRTRSTEEPR